MFVQKKLYLFATGELKFGHLNYVFFKNHFNHLLEKVAWNVLQKEFLKNNEIKAFKGPKNLKS